MILTPDTANPIRPGEELSLGTLQAYITDNMSGFGQIMAIRQFPGGYSNLTYLLVTAEQDYVLRRPPVGAKDIKGGHDMIREFRVLSMLKAAGYGKIPKPVVFCADESVMGYPFYVMERVPGVILRAQMASELDLSVETMCQLSESLVDALVELHALDIVATGLAELGKPEGYVRRQVEGWHKRYQQAQTDEVPAMDQLARYLTDNLPIENPPTLLHNDFKYDNLVLNAGNLTQIEAVLDWEMCTVGDPLMDVGTALSYWGEADDRRFLKSFNISHLPGNLTRQGFAHRYAERSGRDVSNLLYYYVFGLFKNSVVMQQIYGRYKKGLTTDPRFAGLLAGVQSLSQKGTDTLNAGRF